MKLIPVLIVALVCTFLFVSPAQAILLDFNSLAVGTVVTNQFAPQGAIFSGISGSATVIFPDLALQVLSPNPPYAGDFRVNFLAPMHNVMFDSGFWDQVGTAAIDIYGIGDAYLGSVTNLFTHGQLGGNYEHFDLTGFGNITRIDFDSVLDPNGGAMDNLQYDSVPEPASLVLLGVGLAGFAARRRRRNKN